MGVNAGFLVFMAATSREDLEAAVKDFQATKVPGGQREFTYSEFFQFQSTASNNGRMIEASAETVARYALAADLKRDLPKLQERHFNVFIAQYEHDAEYDTIGMVMTGIKQWRLQYADVEVAFRVDSSSRNDQERHWPETE